MEHIFQKLAGDGRVHSIQQRCFFIQNQIGIVGDATGNREKIFEQ